MIMTMRIAIVLNPLDHDFPESVGEINALRRKQVIGLVADTLQRCGHQTVCMDDGRGLADLEKQLRRAKPHLVFYQSVRVAPDSPLGAVPALLERLRIPYTGSAPSACRAAQDKRMTKELLQAAGIRTPDFAVIQDINRIPRKVPPFPLFIKPLMGGCSYGIPDENPARDSRSLKDTLSTILHDTHQTALVETFLSGREFTIGVLGNQPAAALPVMEYVLDHDKSDFRSFGDKTNPDHREKWICPAVLSDEYRAALVNLALDAYRIIGCRDYARVDLRCDQDGLPFVLEINAHPSLLPSSSFSHMATAAGYSFRTMIEAIVDFALARVERIGAQRDTDKMENPLVD